MVWLSAIYEPPMSGVEEEGRTSNCAKWPPGAPPGASGELPGSLPGGPRGPQEAPRAPQDGSKSRQERPKSRPEAVPERPWRAPGADLAPKSPQEGSRKRFLPPRGSIPDAFFGSLSTATKYRAKRQEEKATKLPGPQDLAPRAYARRGRRQGRSL